MRFVKIAMLLSAFVLSGGANAQDQMMTLDIQVKNRSSKDVEVAGAPFAAGSCSSGNVTCNTSTQYDQDISAAWVTISVSDGTSMRALSDYQEAGEITANFNLGPAKPVAAIQTDSEGWFTTPMFFNYTDATNVDRELAWPVGETVNVVPAGVKISYEINKTSSYANRPLLVVVFENF